MTHDELFNLIEELVMKHSPSGDEKEVDRFLLSKFADLGWEVGLDPAGNIIAKRNGQKPGSIAITAHKDEIGMIVKSIKNHGRVAVRRLGGSFPWVYGEGVVDLLGDYYTIPGILSFGSRHVSHESPQKALQDQAPLVWENAWVETKCSLKELELAGIRPGTKVVVGKHRKKPVRLKNYVASYTLDNKASVAILLGLAAQLTDPVYDIYLVASAKEEVGALGALYFTARQRIDILISLEIFPLSVEYPIYDSTIPVLLSQDAYSIYDDGLNLELKQVADLLGIPVQFAVISGFGSDASIAMKFGHVARGACLSFPTENTHGYEIAHLSAMIECIYLLKGYVQTKQDNW